ncbi:unnamed protein product [Microthlaspi erraticum]|uniref:Uncharacterized protein n=1 Tax=Microthlaspi erraticum TaxID=1685480 RepID=A0A6D2LNC2_9BRAS|nr:unnamed protein product [Microthlaspi erraticum]
MMTSSLLSLCLSGNDLESLQNNISQPYHLKWLDIKNWKKLKSVPVLPPNLQLTGIALCAVILFPDNQEHQSNRFLVKCTCEFESKDGPCISFTSIVGGWSVAGDEPRKIESAHVFIGYTSWLDIKKRHVENHGKGCIPSKASLRFQVTDGASEVARCQVLKCGFSLVYTPNDVDDISWETIGDIALMKKEKDVDDGNSNKHPRNDYSFWNQLNCCATSRRVECEELAEANISRTCFLD